MNPELLRHCDLRARLESLIPVAPAEARPGTGPAVDVVVTPNEMNDRHGTGVLVKRVFAGHRHIFSIRSANHYGGEHSFGDVSCVLGHGGVPRADAYRSVLAVLGDRSVRRILCVPYLADDLLTSIALRDVYGAPLCIWIMDDQNVVQQNIPDALMREALQKSRLRLATHPEMRDAYEAKYGLKFWLLPAVVPGALVRRSADLPSGPRMEQKTGAFVGSIWSPRWLELLCRTLGGSGLATDWYGNDKPPYWEIPRATLAAGGIRAHGILSEPALARALCEHPFVVVPTGTLDRSDGDASAVAELSLPGRILFVVATSGAPVLLLGSDRTPAARFVDRFGVGLTCPYEAAAYRRAVDRITEPAAQARMRENAAAIAGALSGDGSGDWVWASTERGEPVDRRFEDIWTAGAARAPAAAAGGV